MRILKTIPALVILILSGCSMPTAIVSPKADNRVTGLSEEVKAGFPEGMKHHEETGFMYEFKFDRDNLYLKLATSDLDDIRKIVYFGFSVWIDRKGEKNQDQGFRFPGPARLSQLDISSGMSQLTTSIFYLQASTFQLPASDSQGKTGKAGIGNLNSILERAEEIDLIGIYGTAARTVKMRDSPIKVKASISGDILTYEAVVPFEILEFGYNPIAGDSNMSIGFKTGHFEAPSRRDREMQPYTGPSDRTGRRGPGQYPGQYPGRYPERIPERTVTDSRSSEMARLSRPTGLWLALEFDTSFQDF